MVLALCAGWLAMQLHMFNKGPTGNTEFSGMYLVVAFYFGVINCGIAFPAHLFALLKYSGAKRHWISAAVSVALSVGLLLVMQFLA